MPYLFVRGNHDATSAHRHRGASTGIAQIPKNVTLLQPPEGGVPRGKSLGGVTIAGFNDPRWFGDSGTGVARPSRSRPREAFERSLQRADAPGRRRQPRAVGTSRTWRPESELNGHMHSTDLEGNRVQVGHLHRRWSADLHFLADEGGGGRARSASHSAFDVLTFGTDCRLLVADPSATASATSSRAGRPTTTSRSPTATGSTPATRGPRAHLRARHRRRARHPRGGVRPRSAVGPRAPPRPCGRGRAG